MAFSYLNNPSTQKPRSVLLAIFISFFVLVARKENSAEGVSFNYNKFTQGDQKIILQGNAQILGNGTLPLTDRSNPSLNTGRALYSEPVSIGNIVSFVTSFSFVVEDIQGATPADGIIFFLVPQDSQIPKSSSGGRLGIVDVNDAFNQFVGVEFDSFNNTWDPNSPHIGIDVNSLISLKTTKWNRVSGSMVRVTITYDSLTKLLNVVVTQANNSITTITQQVDLKAVLPEMVRVGFSATTTDGGKETHDIHSWSFTTV